MPANFKPVEEKRRLGNPGQRKLPEPIASQPQLSAESATTSPLGAIEAIMSHASIWLGETDALAMALLYEMLQEREEIKKLIPAGEATRTQLRQLETQILALLRDLGLNPIARSKIGLSEVQAASTLDQMRNRKQN